MKFACILPPLEQRDSTLLKVNGIYWEAFPELDQPASRLTGAFGWLRGLDLNQRPLGYELNVIVTESHQIRCKSLMPVAKLTHCPRGISTRFSTKSRSICQLQGHVPSLTADAKALGEYPGGVGLSCRV